MSLLSLEHEAEIYKLNLIEENEKKLSEYFVNLREVGGIPITKDNFEQVFDNWLSDLTLTDLEEIL
jgi:hypothetical protein